MTVLLPPFQFGCLLFLYSCLIFVVRISNTMLNRSGESGHPYLLPDLRGNNFRFFSLNMMLAIVFSYMAFIMLRHAHYISNLLSNFIINVCYALSNAFSASINMIIWFLSFLLLMWCITFVDLQILCHPYIPGINPNWSCCMIFLIIAGSGLPIFCWRF